MMKKQRKHIYLPTKDINLMQEEIENNPKVTGFSDLFIHLFYENKHLEKELSELKKLNSIKDSVASIRYVRKDLLYFINLFEDLAPRMAGKTEKELQAVIENARENVEKKLNNLG